MMMQAEEMWIDGEGRHVPADLVKPIDKMKDEVVRRLNAQAEEVQACMAAFKQLALAEAFAAKALIFERYGATLGGKKGNFSLTSYDGSMAVEVQVADRIAFGPELQAARALIDECIESWAEGGNANIRALVDYAFQVNKAGGIDTGRILGLRKLDMKGPDGTPDQKWLTAMSAISDAIQVNGTATYIRFKKKDARGVLTSTVLDFASL